MLEIDETGNAAIALIPLGEPVVLDEGPDTETGVVFSEQ